MNFVVAIPSYQRHKTIGKKTLAFLARESIPKESIYIFVASEQEKQLYAQTLDPQTYGHLVVGVLGLAEQVEFIMSFFPKGQKILRMDDDLYGLKWLNTPRPLIAFANEMFAICEEEKVNLWSIQPASTTLYCRERVSIGKIFCVGCFCGYINIHDTPFLPVSACEDKWYSLHRYTTDGKTLRYDGCCPHTFYFSKTGGLEEYRKTKQHSDTERVCSLFPAECKLTKRKNGVSECFFKQIRVKERQLIQKLQESLHPQAASGSVSWAEPLEEEIHHE